MNLVTKAALISAVVILAVVGGFFIFLRDAPPPQATPDSAVVDTSPESVDDIAEPVAGTPFTQPITQEAVDVTAKVAQKGTGRTLAQARLVVTQEFDGQRSGPAVWDSGRDGGRDGSFKFQLPPGAFMFHAQCPGFTGERRSVTIVKGTPVELVFELERGNSIAGRVIDEATGAGIGGARVYAFKELSAPGADLEESLIALTELDKMTNYVFSETVTRDDGSYQLDGLEAHWFSIRAIAPGYSPGEVQKVPAPREQVNVALAAGNLVAGTVVESGGGPIEGARVDAFREPRTSAMFEIILAKSRPPVDTVFSDAGGAFQFETLGRGVYNFVISAPGFQNSTQTKIEIESAADLRFELRPGGIISGIVEGPEGEPVAGAKIRYQRIGSSAGGRPDIVAIRFNDDSVQSDQDGRFLLDTLEDGSYNLTVFHPDYESLRRKGLQVGSEDVTLKMGIGGRIAGIVTDIGGNAIPGARIVANDVADLRKEAISDEAGNFLLQGIKVDRRVVNVTVTADGFARQQDKVRVTANQQVEHNFQMEATGVLTGLVVNSNNDPVGGARVMVKKSHQNGSVDYTIANASTDRDGRYTIDSVEANDELWVRVKRSGYLEGISDFFLLESAGAVELPPIVLQLGATIAGRVTANGIPVSGCSVTFRRPGETATTAMNATAQTNADGEYRLQGLESGTVDVVVSHVDYMEAVVSGVAALEGEVQSHVDVELAAGSTLSGRVTNEDGAAVIGAVVIARDFTRGASESRGKTGSDGHFEIKRLATSSTVELEVSHDEYATYLVDQVDVGESLSVVLQALGKVRGVVKDAMGEIVPAFSVHPQPRSKARRARSQLRAQTFNTEDGIFTYERVPAGTYDVQVRAPAFSGATIADVVVETGGIIDLGEIVLKSGGQVNGVIIDAESGEPVFNARVSIVEGVGRFLANVSPSPSGGGGRKTPTQTTDSRGRFSFSDLKGGELTLRIRHPEFVTIEVKANPDLESDSQDLEISLERGGQVSGTVLEPDGTSRANVQVFLIGSDPSMNQSLRTDQQGRFSFNNVVPGDYSVKAHVYASGADRKLRVAEASLTVTSGGGRDVVLELQAQ